MNKTLHFLFLVYFLFLCFTAYCQNTTRCLIQGKVIDAKGSPVPFASIHLKNAQYGTYSDSVGNFGLQFIQSDSLIASAIGYKAKCIYPALTAANVIALEEKEVAVQEVRIIGTRAVKKNVEPYGIFFEKPDFRFGHSCGAVIVTEVLIPTQSILKTINADLAFSKTSTAPVTVIRPMVYTADAMGKPGQLLFASKQLYSIKNRTRTLTINLEKEQIVMGHQKVFIGFEFMWNETHQGVRFVGNQQVAKSAAASLRCNPNLVVRKTWSQYRGGAWTNNYWTFMGHTMNAAIYGEIISYE